MILSVELGIESLNKLWKPSQNVSDQLIDETKKILCQIAINDDSINSLCRFSQNLKRCKFEIILFQSPFILVYIEDLLIKSIQIQKYDQYRLIQNFQKIKDITIKSKHINLQLKDLINYYYLVVNDKSQNLINILQQINQHFDKIIQDLKIYPYQINPIYKMKDIFQEEESILKNDYNSAYHILKENIIQGLRMAANSLINSGLNNINQFQTRLVNIYSNVRPISFNIDKYDFKILIEVQLTSDLFEQLQSLEGEELEKQQKQILKHNSLIVVTNLQIFAYFQIFSAAWSSDLLHPAIDIKPLDFQSLDNFMRIVNTKNQTIVLESKSQHYVNYKYLSYLIEQVDKPRLSQDIIQYIDDLSKYGIEEIKSTNDSEIQIKQISKVIDQRLNIIFTCPSTNDQLLIEQIIKAGGDYKRKKKTNYTNFLIICQNNYVKKKLANIDQIKSIQEDFDYNEDENQQGKNKLDSCYKELCESLFQNMIIPNYKISEQDIKLCCSDLYDQIINQYAFMNTLVIQKLCENCKKNIIEEWIMMGQFDKLELKCRCNTHRIIDNQQLKDKWQKTYRLFQLNNFGYIVKPKPRMLQLPTIQRNRNIFTILEDEDLEEENDELNILGAGKRQNRILKTQQKLKNVSSFAKDYLTYKQNLPVFNQGIVYDEIAVNILLNGQNFLWALVKTDRNYLLGYIYSRRYIQNLSLFLYYYEKIQDIQVNNRQDKDSELQNQYLACQVLVSSILNMSNYLSLIQDIGNHTLIIIGANRFSQGHLYSYIRKNTERIILIGDQNQIDTNLFIENFRDSIQIKSHFKVLSGFIQDQLDSIELTIQTEASKQIFQLIQKFYPNLQNQNRRWKNPPKGIWKYIQFFQHEWKESINYQLYTIQNEEEAKMVTQFARYLILSGNKEKDIFIITFTHKQKILIKRFLNHHKINIEVGTPLAFDGRYRKIVIVSMVRSNKEYQIGVLRNVNKIITAFTRSQHSLFVFGNLFMIEDGLLETYDYQNSFNQNLIDKYIDMMDYIRQNRMIKNFIELEMENIDFQPILIQNCSQLMKQNQKLDTDDQKEGNSNKQKRNRSQSNQSRQSTIIRDNKKQEMNQQDQIKKTKSQKRNNKRRGRKP